MAKSFSDRLLLRRISKTFNTKVFSKQNNVVAKAVNISPEWIHQSRLNFRYIYENLGAFWPYWAEKQFSPFRSNSTPPNNELSCLNTSMLHRLQFENTASDSGFNIDESGFLTFPNKHWGLSIKQRIDHDVCPIFDTPFYLDTKTNAIIGETISETLKFKGTFGVNRESNTTQFCLELKNPTSASVKRQVLLGILPHTDEGIGSIRTIQYLSSKQLVINDQSILSCTAQPNNVLCIDYDAGNVFKRSESWEMILAANCENCLASGVIAYNLDLQANQSIKLYFEITHAQSFLTPLSFPIKKINPTIIQKAALTDSQSFSPAIELPNHTFKLNQLSSIKSSIEIAMQNYLLTITKNHANWSLPSLYFNLTSVLSCGAHESFSYIIDHYLSNHKTYYTPSFLLEQQHHLFCLTTILTAHHTYRLSHHALQERLLKKIHSLIKQDPFFKLIKTMTSDQFAKLIKGKQGYQIIFKLMLFAYLMKQISKHKLGSKYSTEFLNTCHHYLKSIQNQPSLFQTFIIQYFQTNQFPITEKLFFSQLLFPLFLPQRFVQELINQLKTYWHGDQFLEPTASKGFSEQNQLIYAFLMPMDERQKIITTFSKNLGSFGHYFSTQSFYHQFNVFPKPFCSFNGTFLALFFSTVFSLDDNKLHLNVLTNYSSIAFTGLKTPYGQLDLSIQKDSVSKIHTVEIKHEFHTPPSAIILTCPPQFNMFAFNDSNQQHPINDGQVSVPLNQSKLSLYS